MSVTIRGKEVSITAAAQPQIEKFIATDLFKDWVKNLDPSISPKSIEVQSMDTFSTGRTGFVKFTSNVERNGIKIPGICLLRGAAVAMLLKITDATTGEIWSILTEQPRVPTGKILREIPAGMVDGSGNFKGVAMRELEEECGLKARDEDLIDLTQKAYGDHHPGIYTSPGLLDEFIRLFLWRMTLPHERIVELNGKLGGEDEHEQIVLRLVPFNKVWREAADGKSLSALQLTAQLEATGEI